MSQLSLKICFANEIHKSSKIPRNFEGLMATIRSIFRTELPEYFDLKYEDVDGDKIMLLNDDDYQSFLDTAKRLEKLGKVYVTPQLSDHSELVKESQKYETIGRDSLVKNQTNELYTNFAAQELIESKQIQKADINKCESEMSNSFDSSLYKLIEKNLGPQKKMVLGDDMRISLTSSIQVPNPFEINNSEKLKIYDNLLNKPDSQGLKNSSNVFINNVKEDRDCIEIDTKSQILGGIIEENIQNEQEEPNNKFHNIGHLIPEENFKPLINNEINEEIGQNRERETKQIISEFEDSTKIENIVENHINKLLPILFYLIKDSIPNDSKSLDSQPKFIIPVGVHKNIICHGCKVNPIKGIRYKCSYCLDFNFCQTCEANKEHDHPFIKLKLPLDTKEPQIIEEYAKCLESILKNIESMNFEEQKTIKNLIKPLYKSLNKLQNENKIEQPNVIPLEKVIDPPNVIRFEKIINEPPSRIDEPIKIEKYVIQNPQIEIISSYPDEEILNGALTKELQTVPEIISEKDLVIYKTIEILNTGKKEWPRNLTLRTDGLIKGEEIKLESISPGKSTLVVLPIKSPCKPGNYIMKWRFSYKDQVGNQKYFGEFMIISFEIGSNKSQKVIEEIKNDKDLSQKKISEDEILNNKKQIKEKDSN